LAQLRDSLALAGRVDVRNHLLQLSQDREARNFMPMKNVQQKMRAAKTSFPNVAAFQASELAASTFVTLDDAITLQEETYNGATRVLKVFEEETGTDNLETFDSPWPKRILRVHPFDKHGARFVPIRDDCDSFVAWSLIGCVMCTPALWSITSEAVVDNKDPKGYLMSVAWSMQIKGGKGRNVRGNKKIFDLPKDNTAF
jgi:hypothetical protein